MLLDLQRLKLTTSKTKAFLKPTELLLLLLFIVIIVTFAHTASDMHHHIDAVRTNNVELTTQQLPIYALKTTLRFIIAMVFSILFSIIYALLIIKFERLGKILILLLDILQSIPVLGYLSFTIAGFLILFPSSELGVQAAVIFAIFTVQVWNIAFSLYQSFRAIPDELIEISKKLGLNSWQRFFKLDLPYAMPSLVWNVMLSSSASWFFVVAVESISVGNDVYTVPGIGSYIALAIADRDMKRILYAVATIVITIFVYDQMVFKPLVSWTDKFKIESVAGDTNRESWLYNIIKSSVLVEMIFKPFTIVFRWFYAIRLSFPPIASLGLGSKTSQGLIIPSQASARGGWALYDLLWRSFLISSAAYLGWLFYSYHDRIEYIEFKTAFYLGGITLLRIIILVSLASIIWLPLGIYIGLRPKFAARSQVLIQFLAAFPSNLLFPIFVYLIQHYHLDPNIWLSPLMIIGTQWYILFNVMAGTAAFSEGLKEVCADLGIKGILKYKKAIIPSVMPYFITGAITASGGAWNATIIAEAVSWGDTKIYAKGLGSYIAINTQAGDLGKVAIGISVMAIIVVLFNKLFWTPLYDYAERITKG
jgi:NitT/TauT family transport system permease protein